MTQAFEFDARDRAIVCAPNAQLSSVSRELMFRQLRQLGYLVLRGFDANLADFSNFVRSRSSRLSLDPARVFYDTQGKAVAQKVDAGSAAIGLHCENGNSPFAPDLCWFFCDRAPEHGSQTTVCDGIEVFKALGKSSQKAFCEREIAYSRHVPRALWQSFVKHSGPEEESPHDDASLFLRLQALVNDGAKTQLRLEGDGSIFYRYQTSALSRKSPFRENYVAFANSIFGPSYNYEQPLISFEDGEAIPVDLLQEAEARCADHTRDIDWQTRDILIIDNRRVMHGRREITDARRSIYNALSYV